MLNLLTSARSIRHLAGTVADAVRSVVAPAALVEAKATEQPAPVAAEPTGLYTDADMPPVADIERAALGYDLAADNARRADRAKRKARKLLDRLPAGQYGQWLVSRTPSSRQVVDLDAVAATYARLGIGAVPMKPCAPSLKVERLAVAAEPTTTAAAELIAA